MHRKFRKPLILMTPKGHLRSKAASSDIQDLISGRFREVLVDPSPKPARRVVVTTGKIAHELNDRIAQDKIEDVSIVRIEQLYPLHEQLLSKVLKGFGERYELVWCQEEPQNMGAWTFIAPALRLSLIHISAFKDANWALLIGSKPRGPGQERADLLKDCLLYTSRCV